eukprot:CAMPEP_0180283488 /NCGR_PEP_ID=MMETSP0988-20121125/10521_1 /TAXON_ID=697907 /ORGANISM="non described non described, Strain CCMP2293" /LENGTH=63 /DNA_ID=CAMNT_0022256061 /DNA_START=330 /DNA_END=521 /DNA_ORIENTATION=-
MPSRHGAWLAQAHPRVRLRSSAPPQRPSVARRQQSSYASSSPSALAALAPRALWWSKGGGRFL